MADESSLTANAILDAARAEVLSHGIRRTTASDIARHADVSRQTLYRYWPDAQAIFAALITRELIATLPVSAPRAGSLDQLVAMLVDTTDGIRRMPLVDRLRTTDPELFARYVFERLGTSQRAILGDLTRRIAEGQDDGFVRAAHPERLAAVVLLAMQSVVQSAPLVSEWIEDDAWRDELSVLLSGYLGER
ncbi:TetR/AcrR family transcriptional regulator [Microbacterium koreense]|uniref:TetR/AcrR family transcriptional regulator n=1 Tax=Microbacterium koreense TaxID=323761 RepID=A0ABW2ZUM0_9MICO